MSRELIRALSAQEYLARVVYGEDRLALRAAEPPGLGRLQLLAADGALEDPGERGALSLFSARGEEGDRLVEILLDVEELGESEKLEDLRVYVNDTGVGIPEADLPYVFDRFYQVRTKRETGGAGLGLSIVRKILEAHGETISVESSENNGSSFWFELPVAAIRKKVA